MTPIEINFSSFLSYATLLRAKDLATMAHGGTMYGAQPYTYHLQRVEDNVMRYMQARAHWLRTPKEWGLRMAAWLHDTIEDTPVTKDLIEAFWGKDLATLVDRVTDRFLLGNKDRLTTYERIRSNPFAVYLKLCDRLANMAERDKLKHYQKDDLFETTLRRKGEFDDLWNDYRLLFWERVEP